ncbi:MAG TPA: hypothetical protein VKL99_01905 [Candidatus Angelobacter sp.]|nr:hypothetical protein [Candidatus Angelobacter sp.]
MSNISKMSNLTAHGQYTEKLFIFWTHAAHSPVLNSRLIREQAVLFGSPALILDFVHRVFQVVKDHGFCVRIIYLELWNVMDNVTVSNNNDEIIQLVKSYLSVPVPGLGTFL